ncbi:MAG: hypothetical protein KAR87_02115 [Candidatus Aenigmarchaeota archaeon]|nr:hypothetical protein [Candidatus Aenigmarchaeota archaeon]
MKKTQFISLLKKSEVYCPDNDIKTAERVNNALLKDGKMHVGCQVICTMNYYQKGICNEIQAY